MAGSGKESAILSGQHSDSTRASRGGWTPPTALIPAGRGACRPIAVRGRASPCRWLRHRHPATRGHPARQAPYGECFARPLHSALWAEAGRLTFAQGAPAPAAWGRRGLCPPLIHRRWGASNRWGDLCLAAPPSPSATWLGPGAPQGAAQRLLLAPLPMATAPVTVWPVASDVLLEVDDLLLVGHGLPWLQ